MSRSVLRVAKQTALYTFSTVLARIASIALLPVYTRFLSPAQYGLLQLLELAAEVTYIMFTAGTRSGMMRFYYRTKDPEERKTVISTTFLLEMGLAAAGASVLFLAAHPVWRLMLVGEGTPGLVRLAALNFLLGSLANTPLALLSTEQRATAYSLSQVVKLALQISFNLYFLVHLDMGVQGMLLSSVIVNAIIGLSLATWMLSRTGIRINRDVVSQLRRFGVPHQLTIAAGFILTFGDRFFLQRLTGAESVGLYALAYQFGFLLFQMGAGPFLKAWEPVRHSRVNDSRSSRDSETATGFFAYSFVVLTLGTGISVGVRPALTLLTAPSYHAAATLVPVIVAAYVVHAWVEAVRFGIDVAEKTLYYTYASWIAAGVVFVGYATLIPRYGAMGAAIATLVAFLFRLALTAYWSKLLWPVNYGWMRVLPAAAVAVAFSAAGAWIQSPSLGHQVLNATLLMVGYFVIMSALFLRPAFVRSVLSSLRKPGTS